jgi:hypothetical protein
MNQAIIDVGDPVRITAGTYKGAEGVVEDLMDECSAVRVHTKEGAAYSFLEHAVRIIKPKPVKAPLRRK